MEEEMFLMPTYQKTRSANTNAGFEYNASYHIAKIVEDEIRPLCGSNNVEGPAEHLDRGAVPFGVCGRCKQLAKI
jgi:hypothetical protein